MFENRNENFGKKNHHTFVHTLISQNVYTFWNIDYCDNQLIIVVYTS